MMKPDNVDPREMELRQNRDYMASLDMIGEGAPVYETEKDETVMKKISDTNETLH